tara:strand:+ start:324 stop:584 length:261 start_codon:yes stop_codon:yes gene_type:complete
MYYKKTLKKKLFKLNKLKKIFSNKKKSLKRKKNLGKSKKPKLNKKRVRSKKQLKRYKGGAKFQPLTDMSNYAQDSINEAVINFKGE